MGQKIRDGRAALDRLEDGLAAIADLAGEIDRSLLPPNIRLIQRNVQLIGDSVADLRRFVQHKLSPMLDRRDSAAAEQVRAAHVVEELAARLRDLEQRVAVLERSAIPDRVRRE